MTGFIPCTKGQTISFEDFHVAAVNSVSGYNYCYINAYNSSKTLIKAIYAKDMYNISPNHAEKDSNNYLTKLTMNLGISNQSLENMAYVRISAVGIGNNPAIYIE